MQFLTSHILTHLLSFMPSHSQPHPPTPTHTQYTEEFHLCIFCLISHRLARQHDIWIFRTVVQSCQLPLWLFIWIDPELSAQTGDTGSYICTIDTPTHTENLSSPPLISTSHSPLLLSQSLHLYRILHLPHGLSRLLLSVIPSPLPSHLPSLFSPAEQGTADLSDQRSQPPSLAAKTPPPTSPAPSHPSAFHMHAESVLST